MAPLDILRSRIEIAESVVEVSGRILTGTPKSGKSRSITIPAFLRDRLNDRLLVEEAALGADGLVFTSSSGGP